MKTRGRVKRGFIQKLIQWLWTHMIKCFRVFIVQQCHIVWTMLDVGSFFDRVIHIRGVF